MAKARYKADDCTLVIGGTEVRGTNLESAQRAIQRRFGVCVRLKDGSEPGTVLLGCPTGSDASAIHEYARYHLIPAVCALVTEVIDDVDMWADAIVTTEGYEVQERLLGPGGK